MNASAERFEPLLIAGTLMLASAALLIYWPAVHGGFIFDDEALLTNNELVAASDGLRRIWFTTDAHDYWPITNSLFWLQWRLWGASPTGYHLVNLALHVGSSVLAWRLFRLIGVPGAFFAALIFVVHPVNVESVAWIAQQKNTWSLMFMLVAAWLYEQPAQTPARRTLAVLAFLAAMLSKGSAVVLPPLLLLVAWWRRGRIDAGDLWRTAPYFAIGFALTLVNIWFQTHGGEPIRDATVTERLLGAGAALWFYWWKGLLPLGLSFIYPLWSIDASNILWWVPLVSALAVTVALWLLRKTAVGRAMLFAWIFVGVALVPVLGFTDVYFMKYSLVADHYQYIAILGIVGLIASAAVRAADAVMPRR